MGGGEGVENEMVRRPVSEWGGAWAEGKSVGVASPSRDGGKEEAAQSQ